MSDTLWPKTAPRFVARLLSAHGALGLAMGALLYILCLSGSVMVFHGEVERWEAASAPLTSTLTPAQLQSAGEAALARVETPPNHLLFALPEAHKPYLTVSNETDTYFVEQDGTLSGKVHHSLADFLENLHYYFHLPSTLGLIVTGLLGAMMLGLILSGFLAHPKIFRDAFAFRIRPGARLTLTDLHNRISVWAAPFHIAIALTGALLGLATIVALSIAMMFYGGDTSKVFAPIFGGAHPVDESPSTLAAIDTAYAHFAANYGAAKPWYLVVHDPMTQGQLIDIRARHPDRLILDEVYHYNGAGEFMGVAGYEQGEAGKQVAMSVYSVHFGNYGGLPVKIVYLILGLSLTLVTTSGIDIWLKKRREKGRPAPRLERAWLGVVWGTPLGLGLAYVLTQLPGAQDLPLAGPFWFAILGAIIASMARLSPPISSLVFRGQTGLLLIAGSIMKLAMDGLDQPLGVHAMTACLALAGISFLISLIFYRGAQFETTEP